MEKYFLDDIIVGIPSLPIKNEYVHDPNEEVLYDYTERAFFESDGDEGYTVSLYLLTEPGHYKLHLWGYGDDEALGFYLSGTDMDWTFVYGKANTFCTYYIDVTETSSVDDFSIDYYDNHIVVPLNARFQVYTDKGNEHYTTLYKVLWTDEPAKETETETLPTETETLPSESESESVPSSSVEIVFPAYLDDYLVEQTNVNAWTTVLLSIIIGMLLLEIFLSKLKL